MQANRQHVAVFSTCPVCFEDLTVFEFKLRISFFGLSSSRSAGHGEAHVSSLSWLSLKSVFISYTSL
jgi:hypothetical protein